MYKITVEQEVEACFREDPKLIHKSLKEIATFFYLQGEMRHTALRSALLAKVEHYRTALSKADFDHLKDADKKWGENEYDN